MGREDSDNDGDEVLDSAADGEEEATVPCPYCKRPIVEDSPRCLYCENYISEEDAPRSAKPWWIILGVGLALYVAYRWIAG